jgi:hypothetical protein
MSASKYLAAAQADLRRQRRLLGGESPQMFTRIYLSSHCPLPFSRMHREVFAALAELVGQRAGRLAIAAPRGHAKSTIVSLAYVLWCVLYEKEKFVLLVSATREQVILLLKAIKDELQQNGALLEDFPEICRPKGAPGQSKPWRDNRILLRNGALISVYGAGQGLRGAKNESHRPGLIIVDDIENYEQVISEEQRQKVGEWFTGTLLHAGHPGTNVIVVGTVLHHDSLLANLINPDDSPGWTGLKYQAIERPSDRPDLWETWSAIFRGKEDHEGHCGPDAAKAFFKSNEGEMQRGAQVLWPEREDYYALPVMREREGQASFQAEKQNEPIDPEVCIFAQENFHCWDDEHDDVESLLDAVGRNGYFFGACDPSLGQRQQLESRLDELDRLAASQVEIKSIAAEALRFLAGLEFTLRKGLPQEKLTALRQCLDRIHVDKPAAEVAITIRTIPTANLDAAQVVQVALATTGPA